MYETIEAIYEDGRIIPLHDELHVKKAKVFLTIVETMEEPEEQGMPLAELAKYKGIFKKFPNGLKYQKELRDEW
ncbi:MAG: DUF104 domain-containing protein [Candidatus Aminicenantes bacterium]|nr:DUF104 domain-containing protein [Candidatus Aminicenantes bacterium]NIM84472.1 DUF104 domain-containing protein [Candidatus Aminicenantes bacterium]NIN23993.1 DUF104 domain-containing protein [Candidatus Aminicenantes bacterium]NIN47707.1 DUF104 domain-containing protein [Candidatus Aminicenantes bacterium]NIN90637.1 DUF104 domain-containing protein [Candidatus Aminicenantes bacterium]